MAKLYPNIQLLEELAEKESVKFELNGRTFEVTVEEVE